MSILGRLFGQGQDGRAPTPITKTYRIDGRDIYVIEFHRQADGTYKLFCFVHPHNPCSTAVNDCHLWSNGEICVAAGKAPRTLDKAKAIGMYWAKHYSAYIRGKKFSNAGGKVNV